MSRIVIITNSMQENSKKELYAVRHFSNGTNINNLESGTVIGLAKCDTVQVKDDESGDDYNAIVIRNKDGEIFYTSSEYFTREIESIYGDFNPFEDGEDGELKIRVLKKQSKNRKMPNGEPALFLTCELV